jgi:hypothetical protein
VGTAGIYSLAPQGSCASDGKAVFFSGRGFRVQGWIGERKVKTVNEVAFWVNDFAPWTGPVVAAKWLGRDMTLNAELDTFGERVNVIRCSY